jgi:hypothetical protein
MGYDSFKKSQAALYIIDYPAQAKNNPDVS